MSEIRYLMKGLGNPTDEEGVCWGLALMAERARRLGEYDKFKKRMDDIDKIDGDVFISNMQTKKQNLAIREAKKKLENGKNLTPEEKELSTQSETELKMSKEEMSLSEEIEAFCFQVWIHYDPKAITEFLELPVQQVFSELDFKKAEEIMFEENPLPSPHSYFLHRPALIDLSQTQRVGRFQSGRSAGRMKSPEVKEENFINQFLETIKESKESVGIVLGSYDHAVHLFYDNQKQKWYLTDHSTLSEPSSTTELLKLLDNIFVEDNKGCNLGFHVFTVIPTNEQTNTLLTTLKSISKASTEMVSNTKLINQLDSTGSTPLIMATNDGLLDAVKILLSKRDINVNQTDNEDITALYRAAENGHDEIVKILLLHPEIEVSKGDTKNNETPFHRAITRGNANVVKAFLDSENPNIDPNLQEEGLTPLALAVTLGKVEIVKVFLESKNPKIDLDAANDEWTPLALAVKHESVAIVKAFLESSNPKIDPDHVTPDGWTPLALAARYGKANIVRAFLETSNPKVDPNRPTPDDWTPLTLAARYGQEEIVKIFLESSNPKVDPNRATPDGWTPFALAVRYGQVEIVKLFLESKNPKVIINAEYLLTLAEQTEIIAMLKKVPNALKSSNEVKTHKQSTATILSTISTTQPVTETEISIHIPTEENVNQSSSSASPHVEGSVFSNLSSSKNKNTSLSVSENKTNKLTEQTTSTAPIVKASPHQNS